MVDSFLGVIFTLLHNNSEISIIVHVLYEDVARRESNRDNLIRQANNFPLIS